MNRVTEIVFVWLRHASRNVSGGSLIARRRSGCAAHLGDCFPTMIGDMNCDHVVDFDDIAPFVARVGATCS